MNTQNAEFLKNGLKFMGFDEKLGTELEKKMNEGAEAFQLKTQNAFGKDGKEKMDSLLNFKRSTQGDMYFFNSYSALLKKAGETLSQTFYINKNHGVTVKEAYNLLNGRSVNKDLVNQAGEKYNAWIKLDFNETDAKGNYKVKQFHSNYGYDLEKVLAQHPIKELNNAEDKDKLIKSLEKGNVQSVTFVKDGQEQKMFIEATPQFKGLNVYDGKMNRVKDDNVTQQQGKEVAQPAGERQPAQKEKAGQNQKPGKKQNLLPKKREGHKKGVKVG